MAQRTISFDLEAGSGAPLADVAIVLAPDAATTSATSVVLPRRESTRTDASGAASLLFTPSHDIGDTTYSLWIGQSRWSGLTLDDVDIRADQLLADRPADGERTPVGSQTLTERIRAAVAAELEAEGVEALGDRLDQEIIDRRADVDREGDVRAAADRALGARIDAIPHQGDTEGGQTARQVAAAIEAHRADADAHHHPPDITGLASQADLDAEAQARRDGDEALAGRIDAETAAREAADTALGDRIDRLPTGASYLARIDVTPDNIAAADDLDGLYQITLSDVHTDGLADVNELEIWFGGEPIHVVNPWEPVETTVLTVEIDTTEERDIGLAGQDTLRVLAVFRVRAGGGSRYVGQAGTVLTVGQIGTASSADLAAEADTREAADTALGRRIDAIPPPPDIGPVAAAAQAAGRAADAAAAAAQANTATINNLAVFGQYELNPGGIPGADPPDFIALTISTKRTPKIISRLRVNLGGVIVADLNRIARPVPPVVDPLAEFNQSANTYWLSGGVVNCTFGSEADKRTFRNAVAGTVQNRPQFIHAEIQYQFTDGTSQTDRAHFGVNNNAFRAAGETEFAETVQQVAAADMQDEGSRDVAARADHVHGLPLAAGSGLSFNASDELDHTPQVLRVRLGSMNTSGLRNGAAQALSTSFSALVMVRTLNLPTGAAYDATTGVLTLPVGLWLITGQARIVGTADRGAGHHSLAIFADPEGIDPKQAIGRVDEDSYRDADSWMQVNAVAHIVASGSNDTWAITLEALSSEGSPTATAAWLDILKLA